MANSYQQVLCSLMQLLKNPYEQAVLKQLDKRFAELNQKALALLQKGDLKAEVLHKRLHAMFRRTLLLSTKRLAKKLAHYQIHDQALPYLNLLKHYFEIAAKQLPKQQTELQQRGLLDLVDVVALHKKVEHKPPTKESIKAAYQNLLEAYQQKRLSKTQVQAQLAVLTRLLQLKPAQEQQLAKQLFSSVKLNHTTSPHLISNPTQPGGSQIVWLRAPHNYIGPPLRHNWHNYFGKPVDNREFLMEKTMKLKEPSQYKSPQVTTGPKLL